MTRHTELTAGRGFHKGLSQSYARQMFGADHVRVVRRGKSEAEIRKWLLEIINDPYWRLAWNVSIEGISRTVSVDRRYIDRFINKTSKDAISHAFPKLNGFIDRFEAGEIGFTYGRKPMPIWFEGPQQRARQHRMVATDAWRWFDPCIGCGTREYQVTTEGIACRRCVDPAFMTLLDIQLPLPIESRLA